MGRLKRVASAVLLSSAAALSIGAVRRLGELHTRPENALPYFIAFGLTLLLSVSAGLVAPPPGTAPIEPPAAPPPGRQGRALRFLAAAGTVLLFGLAWSRQGRPAAPLPTVWAWAGALALGAAAFASPRGPRSGEAPRQEPAGILVALALVLGAAAGARAFGLRDRPPVFAGDEAAQVLDGMRLVGGELSPDPFGTGFFGTGRLGMLPAGAGALVSTDPIAGPRLPYAIAGALSVAACAAAAGLVSGGWGALGCAALLAFASHHLHFSRLSSVNILDSLLAAAVALSLFAASRSGSRLCGYLAGVSAGLSLYGYAGGRVIAVGFLLSLPFLILATTVPGRQRRWLLVSLLAGFALAAAPGLRFAVHHPGEWNARLNLVGIFDPAWYPGWWHERVAALGSTGRVLESQLFQGTIDLLCLHTGSDWYTGYPVLSPNVLPALALVGLGWMAGRRQVFPAALLALLALGNLANVILTVGPPSPQRISSLLPALAILGGAAIAGFLETLAPAGAGRAPVREAIGTLVVGATIVTALKGPPDPWDPSPGYGGQQAALAQSAYEILRAPRFRGETILFHGRPYVDSSFPSFPYFFPRTRMVDVGPGSLGPGWHLFATKWLSAAYEAKQSLGIRFGIPLGGPEHPEQEIGYLLRVGPPAADR